MLATSYREIGGRFDLHRKRKREPGWDCERHKVGRKNNIPNGLIPRTGRRVTEKTRESHNHRGRGPIPRGGRFLGLGKEGIECRIPFFLLLALTSSEQSNMADISLPNYLQRLAQRRGRSQFSGCSSTKLLGREVKFSVRIFRGGRRGE